MNDPQRYLRLHQLEPYFEDAFRHAMIAPTESPAERMRAYFRRVLSMKHVAGREYAFISATVWNRRAFIVVFHAAIEHLLSVDLTVNDFYQILSLLSPDFPRSVLDDVLRFLPRTVVNDGTVSCATLATAFEVHWFYSTLFAALEPLFQQQQQQQQHALENAPTLDTLPPRDLEAAVEIWNQAQDPSAIMPWPVLEHALVAAGVDSAISFRRLSQALLQSEPLAARIRVVPETRQHSNEDLVAILEGRAARSLTDDGELLRLRPDPPSASTRGKGQRTSASSSSSSPR